MWVQTVKIFPLTPADGCWLFLGSDACNEICLKGELWSFDVSKSSNAALILFSDKS